MLGLINNLPQQLTSIVALSLAVAVISMTMTKAKVSKPLRERIKARSEWFGELFSCPYCFSHWVSIAFVAIARPVVVASGFYIFDLFISVLVVVALASLIAGLIFISISAMS